MPKWGDVLYERDQWSPSFRIVVILGLVAWFFYANPEVRNTSRRIIRHLNRAIHNDRVGDFLLHIVVGFLAYMVHELTNLLVTVLRLLLNFGLEHVMGLRVQDGQGRGAPDDDISEFELDPTSVRSIPGCLTWDGMVDDRASANFSC
jgi:hypothetical protein